VVPRATVYGAPIAIARPSEGSRIVICCRYLPRPRLGNLRACCLPWKWWPFLGPPLRNQTLISRHPSSPRSASIRPSKVDGADISVDRRLFKKALQYSCLKNLTPFAEQKEQNSCYKTLLGSAICWSYRVSALMKVEVSKIRSRETKP